MFNTLKKRLTWLYTIVTGAILTLALIGFLIFQMEDTKRTQLNQFQTIWNTISRQVQFDSVITHSWLSQTESDNRLIIHIEENGIPLLYTGSWTPKTARQTLIDRAKKAAALQGVHTLVAPVSSTVNTSSLMTLYGDSRDRYYAMVMSIATPGGVKSLCVISYVTPAAKLLKGAVLFLCLVDCLGIAGLFFVSWRFVGWSLKPVAESQRKQAEFIAAASHELRSPLSVLRSAGTAILAAPEQTKALVRTMDSECARMSRLIGDMLLLASADARTWSIHPEETDLDTLLIDTYEAFLPTCRERNAVLRLELPDRTLPKIEADGERLKQVLFILLDNALTYTPTGSSITLSAVYGDSSSPLYRKKQILISVADQGCGIPDEVKAHIFDRFYKADSSRSDKEHFGLGLSIAKELISLHGGTIEVLDNDGGGSRFLITLHVKKPPAR